MKKWYLLMRDQSTVFWYIFCMKAIHISLKLHCLYSLCTTVRNSSYAGNNTSDAIWSALWFVRIFPCLDNFVNVLCPVVLNEMNKNKQRESWIRLRGFRTSAEVLKYVKLVWGQGTDQLRKRMEAMPLCFCTTRA